MGVSDIVTLARIRIRQQRDTGLRQHPANRIRQLDLPALARRLCFEIIEDFRIEEIASRNREIARRLFDGRLLDKIDDTPALDFQDAIT